MFEYTHWVNDRTEMRNRFNEEQKMQVLFGLHHAQKILDHDNEFAKHVKYWNATYNEKFFHRISKLWNFSNVYLL